MDEIDETRVLRYALDSLDVGYCVLDRELRYQLFNDRYVEILKSPAGEIRIGRPVEEILEALVARGRVRFGDVHESVAVRLAELRTDKPLIREVEDEGGGFVRLSVFPMPSENVLVTLTDITLQKKAEQEKEIKEEQLRRALNNIEGAILMYDKDLRLQVYSARYLEIGNLPEELFLVGESIYPVLLYRAKRGDYGPGDPERLADERALFLRTMPDYLYQEQPMGDGIAEVFWSRDDQGNLISVTNDITHRKQTERLLEQARIDAHAANEAKSGFLANMSHELRTPLNAVIGFSDSMLAGLTGDLNERQREYIHDISKSGAHLLALINDVLDLSKIEAGKLEIDETLFDITAVVEESFSLVREAAARSEIQLRSELIPDAVFVRADQRMMTQILVNLLSNAVKFTPEGGRITVRTQRRKGGDLMVSVSDTGYGMKAEEIPKVLKEFEQTETGRQHGGTGLGLPLTKSMIEMHGGALSIISAPGKGTTVMFSVPLPRIQD